MRKVSSKDVAREAGVSQTTVSYVLSGRAGVSIPEATRLKVMEAARQIGYRPNRAARSLVMGKTHLVALWTARVTSPFCAQMVQRIQKLAGDQGFEIIISGTMHADWPLLSQWSVDGVLAFELPREMINFKDKVQISGIPFVSFGAYYVEGSDFVEVDLYAGGRRAVQHLIDTGRRRIAHVTSVTEREGEPRCDAYSDALATVGLVPEFIITRDDTSAAGYEAMKTFLVENSFPDAIFCRNDEIAIGASRALLDAGLRIPEDLAVVGCDGIDTARFVEPPLTTIEQPIDELCRLAWQYLQQRMADPHCVPQQTVLQPELIIRKSSQRPGEIREKL